MEKPPASEHPSADRSDNVRDQVRNGIGLDGEWEYQRICEGAPGCKPVGAGRFFIQSPTVRTSSLFVVKWIAQLGGAARGLIYIHDQGMIHGDLKGVGSFYVWG